MPRLTDLIAERQRAEARAQAEGAAPARPPLGRNYDSIVRGPVGAMKVVADHTHDVADKLPDQAKERLQHLRQLASEARALLRAVGDERGEAFKDKIAAKTLLDRIESDDRRSVYRDENEMRGSRPWQQANARHEFEAQRVARLDARYNDLAARAEPASRVVESCEALCKQPLRFVEFNGELPKPKKAEHPSATIERCRNEIAQLKAQLKATRKAPYPAAEAKEILRREIDELAAKGAPNVTNLLANGERHYRLWPREKVQHADGRLDLDAFVPSALAVMAWLFKDQVVARIEAEIDAQGSKDALSADEREAADIELQEAISLAERQEAEAVWASNGAVQHRADISALAALGVDAI